MRTRVSASLGLLGAWAWALVLALLPVVAQAGPALPASPSEAAATFDRLGCSGCHVIGDRVSPEGYGPNLGRVGLRTTFFGGATALWNHAPGMYRRMEKRGIDLPKMSGRDLLNVVGFITAYQYYLTRVGRRGNPERGRLLFGEKGCNQCHSLRAGVKIRGPSLYNYGKGRSVLELAQAMWNHGPKMQAMLDKHLVPRPYFREGEMADLLAYLATVQETDRAATAYVEPGDPNRGAQVFEKHHCSKCHAVAGEGGDLPLQPGDEHAPSFGVGGKMAVKDYTDIAAQMWNHAVPMWGRMKRYGIEVGPLENTELADLVAFLYFVDFSDAPADVERGKRLFSKRGCSSCHVPGDGPGSKEAPASSRWDLLARMWSTVPKMIERADELGVDWPRLEDGELKDLTAYVLELQKAGRFATSSTSD